MRALKLFVLIFTAYALFWNLGAKPLAEWDESRYGQIALEMLRNGDYINYYYNGEPEFWTAKPPLSIWSIILSYKSFGFNEFALRFPATLAGVIALVFLFLFFNLYVTEVFVWGCLLIAITTKALIGSHLSRSGDTDVFLVAGLFGFLYFFAKHFRNPSSLSLVWAFLALGLAFMAKGFAIGFYFPVGIFFLVYKSGWKKLIGNPKFYAGLITFLIFPLVWFTVVALYGNTDQGGQYGGSNAIEVMVLFDLVGRFTGAIDAGREGIDLGFIPRSMDIRFGIWWSILCFWGLSAVLRTFGDLSRVGTHRILIFQNDSSRDEAFKLSVTAFVVILFILFVSVVKLDWYLAPVLPFFCLLFMRGLELTYRTHRAIATAFCSFGVGIAIWNQVQYVSWDDTSYPFREFVRQNQQGLSEATEINTSRKLRQNEMLYLAWVNDKPLKVRERFADSMTLDCKQGVCFLGLP